MSLYIDESYGVDGLDEFGQPDNDYKGFSP